MVALVEEDYLVTGIQLELKPLLVEDAAGFRLESAVCIERCHVSAPGDVRNV